MANIIPFSFRGALFSAQHDLATGGNTFNISLYTTNPYTTASTVYLAGTGNQENEENLLKITIKELLLWQ
jgi:hypothetical protein